MPVLRPEVLPLASYLIIVFVLVSQMKKLRLKAINLPTLARVKSIPGSNKDGGGGKHGELYLSDLQ